MNPLLNRTREQSDLLAQTPKERKTISGRAWKPFVTESAAVLLALGTGYIYHAYLSGNASLWSAVGAFGLFGAASVLASLFAQGTMRRTIVIVLEVVALLGFFFPDTSPQLWGAAGAVLVFLAAWGAAQTRKELDHGTRVRFFRAVKPYLGKLLTGVAAAAVILHVPVWQASELLMSKETFSFVFGAAAKAASGVYSGLNFDSSVGDFAESVAKTQLSKEPSFVSLPLGSQQDALRALSGQAVKKLGDTFGVVASPAQTVQEFLYDMFKETLAGWRKAYGDAFIAVWALIAFFAIRSAAFAAHIVIVTIAFTGYHLALVSGVVQIAVENRPHETLEYV